MLLDARIVYPSSLEYWLKDDGVPYRLSVPAIEEKLHGRRGITEIVRMLHFSAPVHIAVPSTVCRRRTRDIIYHKIPEHLPAGSFAQISDYVLISSPEMSFLQAANKMPLHELVNLANNLCAIYVLDKTEEYGQRRREPITCVADIMDYLAQVKDVDGIIKAKKAIRYARDRSNSPMESQIATLGALPVHYGGFGLPLPQLNMDIPLSREGGEFLGRDICCCDMVWLEQKVVLEYDSNMAHSTLRQFTKDKNRSTALALSGYRVISVTAEKVANFRAIETLFTGIRTALGMRTYPARMNKYFEKRWGVVHDIMFKNRCET